MKIRCRGSSVVERGPEKAGVGSPILPPGTKIFEKVFVPNNTSLPAGRQGIRALEGHFSFARVAQLVEQGFRKAQVVRSNRTTGFFISTTYT